MIKVGLKKYKITLLFFLIIHSAFTQVSTSIIVSGFKNNTGKAFIRIQNEEAKTISERVETINNKVVTINQELKVGGKYAIEVFHDENNNQKLDTNPVGFPKEAWGVSNNVRPTFRGPNLKEMLVTISAQTIIKIKIK